MPLNNTGNPIPSSSPLDRHDNTIIYDRLINDRNAESVPDRFGDPLKTWHAISNAANEIIIAGGQIFESEEAGRDAVQDGQYYYSVSDDPDVSKILWRRIDADNSEFIADEPSQEFITESTNLALDKASEPSVVAAEFHAKESENISFSVIDPFGNQISSWDKLGNLRQKIFSEFYTSEKLNLDDTFYYLTDQYGFVILSVDVEGHLNGAKPDGNRGQSLFPYVNGDEWRATDTEDHLISVVPEGYLLSTYPYDSFSVIGVVNSPSLGATTVVQASKESGLAIPCSDKVLHVVLGVGQSLMTGGRAQNSLVSVEPEYPEHALMLDCGADSDVRFTPALEDGVIDPSRISGFTPLRAVATGIHGQTPMESCINRCLEKMESALGDVANQYLAINGAKSGTAYVELKKGTQPYINMMQALGKAHDLASSQGYAVVVDAVLHKHGEGDAFSTTYYDDLIEWQSDIFTDVKAITGQQKNPPFIMAQPSGWTTENPRAMLAMLQAHVESPHHWLSGSDYPYADKYDIERDDFTHFTGPGYFLIGEKMSDAFINLIWRPPGNWDVVRIKDATRIGNVVSLTYSVPVPPLVTDTVLISSRDFLGFRYLVDEVDQTIASIEIVSDGSDGMDALVNITLSSAPSGSLEEVYYAMGPHSDPRTVEGQPRGNIRDSSPAVSAYDQRPLYNWGVHQKITVQVS